MSHSKSYIWVHGIFSVKYRKASIERHVEEELYNFILKKSEELDCPLKNINGKEDHIHVLFTLSRNLALRDYFKSIKGSSSHWINQNNFLRHKFAWQVGYSAFSVSPRNVKNTFNYIENQKRHHRKMTFEEEIQKLFDHYEETIKIV